MAERGFNLHGQSDNAKETTYHNIDTLLTQSLSRGIAMEQMSGMDASSYNGNIAITANSCREMMPHPEFFAQCLQGSYDGLKTAAIGG